uniref:Zinc finger CCHC domain-containing protein n=1 Tax=Sinocyclocheilus rhinocerous TaxID=307959 RepID=A0A673I7J0_9TELE
MGVAFSGFLPAVSWWHHFSALLAKIKCSLEPGLAPSTPHKVEDTATWLSMHCTVLNTSLMRDEDGIKTGASKFQVRLKKDTEGNYHHLPSLIQLGPIRGYVFYNGQPKECRKCGSLDHILKPSLCLCLCCLEDHQHRTLF